MRLAIRAMGPMVVCLLIPAFVLAAPSLFPDDAVNVKLTLGATTIFDTVLDPAPPFSLLGVTVGPIRYTLTLFDDGFNLDVSCVGCGFPPPQQAGLKLVLSGLDFTPPAALTGLNVDPFSDLTPIAGSPTFTASSLTVQFADFTADSADYRATFVTAVPLPATLALLLAGLAVAAVLRQRLPA